MSKRNNYVGGGTIINRDGSFASHDSAEGESKKAKLPSWAKKKVVKPYLTPAEREKAEQKKINIAVKGMDKTRRKLQNPRYDEHGCVIAPKRKPTKRSTKPNRKMQPRLR